MSALRRAPTVGRRALLLVTTIVVVVGVVIVLSGSLTRSTDVEAQAARARAELAEMEKLHAAGEKELRFVETEDFISWQARLYDLGEPGERPFVLDDAPSPPPIVPIGPQDQEGVAPAPFDAWMELLFGA
jgi:hypothetical protein